MQTDTEPVKPRGRWNTIWTWFVVVVILLAVIEVLVQAQATPAAQPGVGWSKVDGIDGVYVADMGRGITCYRYYSQMSCVVRP